MKAGKELENYVQFVYQKLLDFMDEGAMVSSNVSVIGKSGVKHEFDVYYEFQHLNMRHRIAMCHIGKKEKQMCQWLSYRKKN